MSGLEGVVAAETEMSLVDGKNGRLIVRGHELEDIAGTLTYEDVASLLWSRVVPGATQSNDLAALFAASREEAWTRLKPLFPLATGMSPLDGLRFGLSALAGNDTEAADLVGAVPVLIAALERQRHGAQPIAPDTNLGQAADFLRMLSGTAPRPVNVAAFETYLVTVADHGMNASTFTSRVIASTRADITGWIVGAISALSGPLHGGAPGPVLDMLDAVEAATSPADWIEAQLAKGERLMGFGHRIYRTRDPRADVLKAALDKLPHDAGRISMARELETAALRALAHRYPDRRLDINVEFYTALLLEAVGLDRSLFTPAFALGRTLGWIAHGYEQVASKRLIRPASEYTGPMPAVSETRPALERVGG